MPDNLSRVELGALAYVAQVRLLEAQSVQTITKGSSLSAAAQAYLEAVEAFFEAVRKREAQPFLVTDEDVRRRLSAG